MIGADLDVTGMANPTIFTSLIFSKTASVVPVDSCACHLTDPNFRIILALGEAHV